MKHSFDELTKAAAHDVSRRGALKQFGTALGVSLLGALGFGSKAQAAKTIKGCTTDADCHNGQVCFNGTCYTPPKGSCVTDFDCSKGQLCSYPPDAAGFGMCYTACTSSADCANGQVCQNGACVTPPAGSCSTSADCRNGQYCQLSFEAGALGTCAAIPVGLCLSNADCPRGTSCDTSGPQPEGTGLSFCV